MPPEKQAKFQIFSGELNAVERDGRKILSTTATSAVELFDGSEITNECVEDMVKQAQQPGMTIFLNHSYRVPEDVFGSMVATRLVMRRNDMGKAVADMDMDIAVDESNPRAVQTYNSIQNGTKIGVSIGCDVVDWEYRDSRQGFDGGIRFKKMMLRETSMVGLPRNPRGWVHSATVALHAAVGPSWNPEDIAIGEEFGDLPDSAFAAVDEDGKHYPHHYQDGAINLRMLRHALAQIANPANPQVGRPHLERHAEELGIDLRKEYSMPPAVTAGDPAVEPDTAMGEMCPECGGSHGEPRNGCTCEYHNNMEQDAAPEPELISDQQESTIEVLPVASSGDTPQETNSLADDNSQVETVMSAAAELTLTGRDQVVMELVLSSLERAVTDLRVTKTEMASRDAEITHLKGELDKANADLSEAVEFVKMLASLPLGRKSQFSAPIQSFQTKFGAVYDEAYLKLIDERNS